jgi:hypothetical protein
VIGVDTNVLARYFVEEGDAEADDATSDADGAVAQACRQSAAAPQRIVGGAEAALQATSQ